MSQEPDLSQLLASAQQMQEQLLAAQAEVAEQVVEGQAGGGMVKVRVSGGMEFESVSIDAEVVDPDDVAMLEDLVLAALHDATSKVQLAQQGAMGSLDLGSLGAGGLGLEGLSG